MVKILRMRGLCSFACFACMTSQSGAKTFVNYDVSISASFIKARRHNQCRVLKEGIKYTYAIGETSALNIFVDLTAKVVARIYNLATILSITLFNKKKTRGTFTSLIFVHVVCNFFIRIPLPPHSSSCTFLFPRIPPPAHSS